MNLHDILQFARAGLAGGIIVFFIIELLLYVVRRRLIHAIGAALLLITGSIIVLRIVIYAPTSPQTTIIAARVSWSLFMLSAPTIAIGLREASGTKFGPATYAVITAGLLGAVFSWVDGALFDPGYAELHEITGFTVHIVKLSSTAPLFVLAVIVPLVLELASVARSATFEVAPSAWRGVTFSGLVVVLGTMNEILQVAGFYRGVGTVEFALGLGTLSLLFVFARYTARAYTVLEQDVETATAALASSLDSLRGLISGLPDMVLVARGDRVEPYNDRARDALGDVALTYDELGATPESAADFEKLLSEATAKATFARLELATTSGPEPVDLVAVAATIDGERVVIANGRTTRERDELERQLRLADRLSSLGTMAAGVAHEINNPIAYIAANLEFIRSELDDEPQRDEELEAIDSAIEGTRRVARIVRDLGTFARFENARSEEPGEVEHALQIALGIARSTLRHSVVLDSDIPAHLPLVSLDTGQLSQVLLNLVINAGDAMPEGRNAAENEVTVTAERAGDDVVVFVRDNGVGMTPAQLEKVFDPFFTTKDVGRGTGLGLSICHTIVERSGGSISAESQPGEGTTFEIRLPIARLATLDAESSAVEASENVRLLLIDDDTRVLEATRRLLSLTYDVETASSASEAKERVLNASFDAVICDVMMPDTNGIEFHAWLRENQPDLAERFAFYTGGAIGPSIQNRLSDADVPVIGKPLERRALDKVLSRFLPDAPQTRRRAQ